MAFRPTPVLRRRARVVLVGAGRMGRIRARAVYSNPRLELAGIVDNNLDGRPARDLGGTYRVSAVRGRGEMISVSFFFVVLFTLPFSRRRPPVRFIRRRSTRRFLTPSTISGRTPAARSTAR